METKDNNSTLEQKIVAYADENFWFLEDGSLEPNRLRDFNNGGNKGGGGRRRLYWQPYLRGAAGGGHCLSYVSVGLVCGAVCAWCLRGERIGEDDGRGLGSERV